MNAHLLDVLRLVGGLDNDAALARMIRVAPPVISNIRSEKAIVGARNMIVINEEFDMPIAEIKALVGKGRPG